MLAFGRRCDVGVAASPIEGLHQPGRREAIHVRRWAGAAHVSQRADASYGPVGASRLGRTRNADGGSACAHSETHHARPAYDATARKEATKPDGKGTAIAVRCSAEGYSANL